MGAKLAFTFTLLGSLSEWSEGFHCQKGFPPEDFSIFFLIFFFVLIRNKRKLKVRKEAKFFFFGFCFQKSLFRCDAGTDAFNVVTELVFTNFRHYGSCSISLLEILSNLSWSRQFESSLRMILGLSQTPASTSTTFNLLSNESNSGCYTT